uniref:Uncharacterized protein n=1 Tax=Chlamydomonas leiostraca TaxID=1034604 RepID=A0A7S0WVL0_9CHLO|mmetsp:Transcript_2979/g.7322  ORF Transcript_2979/g.7322 Transcript_2979/m.7322 type:complete len:416 (+) Transcript_2979:244-1491(+)|eukprot:CAMPEP_0202867344 /NCGR_PEP_ID=MMETSP1391-20130828/9239_1 /ASSEMBLY_ACC=CAM_ASM_000867 /TAXON_ID=1034604 /ORGANISM="Chlamydomonas leiostraca, Strain SAG 11-49" /LENGTH=415 /DNA_ID=CAMNT_0049547383 /DNA_START=245 /DNA_END=1492 /DNA_ORIENTATION=+
MGKGAGPDVQGGPLKKFLIKNFLSLGFVVGVIWALAWYQPGKWCYTRYLDTGHMHWKIISTINIFIIFLIFGLTLETSELKQALKAWQVWLTGLVSILVITALTGFLFVHMGFTPREFGIGLAIFACSPTSLSSGISVVIQGYGNGAMSLFLTVATNLLAIVVSPIFVGIVLGPVGNINKIDLLVKLLVSILLPLIIGKAARELIKPVAKFAKKYKVPLYILNNFQIIMIVWQTLSASRQKLFKQNPGDVLLAIMGAIGQHFLFLVINFIIAWALRFKEAEKKAFIISSSQKSLPTAAVIIEAIKIDPNDPDAMEAGLIAIPCMVFYIMQLFIDAFIASGWASKYERADMLRHKFADELAELYKLDDPESACFLHQPTPVQSTHDGHAAGADANGTIKPPPPYEEKMGLLAGSSH